MSIVIPFEESKRFEEAIQRSARRAAAVNPVKMKPRHSTVIRSEIERARLASVNVKGMICNAEEVIVNAKTTLANAKDRLQQLRAAGLSDGSSEIQKLIGFSSRLSETPHFYPGVIDEASEIVETTEARLKALRARLVNEEERLNTVVLPPLQAELEEALLIERLS